MLRGSRVLFFIDNEGMKEAFVSGTTESKASRTKTMLVEAMIQESRLLEMTACHGTPESHLPATWQTLRPDSSGEN